MSNNNDNGDENDGGGGGIMREIATIDRGSSAIAVEETTSIAAIVQEGDDNDENSNAGERVAMLDRHNPKEQQHANGRSLDEFLEDAYQEHASMTSFCHQWHYWMIMLALGISNSSDASEILCLSYILSDNTFQNAMLHDSPWRGGMLAAAVFLGMLVGGLVVGTLGDWKGRRPMLLFGLALNVTAGLLSACAPNVFFLTGLRMIAGVGIGATVPPLFTLVAELAPSSRRGFFITFCASFWMVGSVFVALVAIAFLKKNDTDKGDKFKNDDNIDDDEESFFVAWRVFALACAIPSALGAAMVYILVPESPRFLALQRRFDEAVISANTLGNSLQYHGSTLYRWELEEHFGTACHSADNYHPSSEILEEIEEGSATWRWIRMATADFFVSAGKLYTPNLRQTTWPLQMVWFSLSFGSYGLMTWINTIFFAVHLEDVYFNALLFALANLPGNLFTAFFMDRAGRSQILVGSILSASLSLLSFAYFANTPDDETPPSTLGVVLSACSFQCFTIAAWNTIDVMTTELFPTTVRSTGMGVCAASGRIGALIAQFVNGALVGRPVRLLVVASITLAIGATTPFFLPEHADMTGRPVQDDFGPEDKLSGVNISRDEDDGDDRDEDRGVKNVQRVPAVVPDGGLSRRGTPNSNASATYQKVAGTVV